MNLPQGQVSLPVTLYTNPLYAVQHCFFLTQEVAVYVGLMHYIEELCPVS